MTTNPATHLDVAGTARANNIQGRSNAVVTYPYSVTAADALIVWGNNGVDSWAERMRVKADGKVGIGRTPTTNKLEVEGDASKTTASTWLANSDKRIKTDIQDIDKKYGVMSGHWTFYA